MKRLGTLKSQNDLAEKAGISKSSLSETLKAGAVQTTVMREIHKALGWPPPLMTPPIHVLELVHAFDQLSDFDQGRWLERMRREVEAAKTER